MSEYKNKEGVYVVHDAWGVIKYEGRLVDAVIQSRLLNMAAGEKRYGISNEDQYLQKFVS